MYELKEIPPGEGGLFLVKVKCEQMQIHSQVKNKGYLKLEVKLCTNMQDCSDGSQRLRAGSS